MNFLKEMFGALVLGTWDMIAITFLAGMASTIIAMVLVHSAGTNLNLLLVRKKDD